MGLLGNVRSKVREKILGPELKPEEVMGILKEMQGLQHKHKLDVRFEDNGHVIYITVACGGITITGPWSPVMARNRLANISGALIEDGK